ncbi:hypothetical protein T484DRAFT_1985627 [Baffinella frigidus]|nr:hypothetical protein T484DRAFT_1985627 [Cryptophyta sp. CCMP2293]
MGRTAESDPQHHRARVLAREQSPVPRHRPRQGPRLRHAASPVVVSKHRGSRRDTCWCDRPVRCLQLPGQAAGRVRGSPSCVC